MIYLKPLHWNSNTTVQFEFELKIHKQFHSCSQILQQICLYLIQNVPDPLITEIIDGLHVWLTNTCGY